jgi:integrase
MLVLEHPAPSEKDAGSKKFAPDKMLDHPQPTRSSVYPVAHSTPKRATNNAHIEIVVPDIIKPLFRKYKGTTRVFDFYQKYSNAANFNKHINKGLHFIADELGIPRFDFYSARHTWASIARNKLGIDKYTIHEALNHVSQLDVTDIYIQKDFTNINKANEKVVEYVTELIKKTKNDA